MSLKSAPILSLIAAAGLSLLVAGCSKNSVNNNIPVGMTAQIGGKSFQALQIKATGLADYVAIAGVGPVGSDTISLTLYIGMPVTLNQQVSSDNNIWAELDEVILRNNIPYAVYSGLNGAGHVNYAVTAMDTTKHTIAGTFSGTLPFSNSAASNLPDSVVVSKGEFNVTYQ